MNAVLASEFEKRARDSVEECFKLGYPPTIFLSMLEEAGAVATAKRLVASVNIQSGLRALANLGRLDLSIESAMLEPKYSSLFSRAELKAAAWRLDNFDKL